VKEINLNIEEIRSLCLSHKVRSLFAFGSVVIDKLKPESDIDLVVDISENDPIIYSDYYFDLKNKLEAIFHRPIDLLEKRTIKNKFFLAQINHSKVKIYEE